MSKQNIKQYSVLMTVYVKDNPNNVKLAIDSILNQTLKTNDFVIICDGPLTNELDILLNLYENSDPIFRVVRLDINIGLGAALQKGVLLCKNELIARMDDDDIAAVDRCEIQLLEFNNHLNLDICGTYMNEFEGNQSNIIRIKKVPLEHYKIVEFSRRRNPFNHSTVMFKKKSILKVGNYGSMRTNQDVDLWVRALNNGLITKNIPLCLVDFRFDANTYKRRKDINNVISMIKVWKSFFNNDYCNFIDFIAVFTIQVSILLLPVRIIKWCYDNFR